MSMKLLNIDPKDLSPNPWNTNQVDPDNMERLSASLERHGWVKPALVRETALGFQILGGQHRVEAAIDLGHDTVPVINLGDISDVKAKEIGLIDNARYGQDDALELAELLTDLGGPDALAVFLPIGEEDLANLATEIDDEDIDDLLNGDDEPSEKQEKPKKTHQIMRFKIPVADADEVQDFFEKIMDNQDFTEADSLTNAGDALLHVVKTFMPGVESDE